MSLSGLFFWCVCSFSLALVGLVLGINNPSPSNTFNNSIQALVWVIFAVVVLLFGAIFLALMETRPELRADASWSELSHEVAARQQLVAVARQAHQEAMAAYDTAAGRFPARWFVGADRG